MWLLSLLRVPLGGFAGYLNAELMVAAKKGNTARVEALLARGADVNARDFGLRTPLMRAARAHRLETLTALLARGAGLNAHDSKGQTALRHAVDPCSAPFGPGACTATVKALLARGAEVDAHDCRCQTPLMRAARSLCSKTVEILLAGGAAANAVDKRRWSALMHAVGWGWEDSQKDILPKFQPEEDPKITSVFGTFTLESLLTAAGGKCPSLPWGYPSSWHKPVIGYSLPKKKGGVGSQFAFSGGC